MGHRMGIWPATFPKIKSGNTNYKKVAVAAQIILTECKKKQSHISVSIQHSAKTAAK